MGWDGFEAIEAVGGNSMASGLGSWRYHGWTGGYVTMSCRRLETTIGDHLGLWRPGRAPKASAFHVDPFVMLLITPHLPRCEIR
jgi:hypothetical protein